MRCAIIGGTGHYYYFLEALEQRGRDDFTAFAPGTVGEDVKGLESAIDKLSKRTGGQFTQPKQYDSWRAMLDRESPDLVIVNPWFRDIAEITCEALSRGHAVFAEKPLATEWDQWEAVRGAAKKNDRLCAMFGIRGEPAFQAAKEAASLLGDIRVMHGQKSYKLGTRGPVYLRRKDYGGIIPWVGIHALDWMRWVSGREFLSVFAAQCCRGNLISTELEVSSSALFTMEDDTIATMSADFLRPAAAARHGDDQLRVTGTNGTLFVRNDEAFLELASEPIRKLPLPDRRSLCAAFMEQLEGGPSCGLTARDALNVTAAALTAREAADDHAAVAVPTVL